MRTGKGSTDEFGRFPVDFRKVDLTHLRDRWPEALQQLEQIFAQGDSFDRREFARAYSLPEDWNWSEVHRRLEESNSPENEFNDLLRAIYRAKPVESQGIADQEKADGH